MNIFERSQANNKDIFLWQERDGQRITVDAKINNIDFTEQLIELKLQGTASEFKMDAPCFLKLPVKDSAMKANLTKLEGQIAVIELPSEAITTENRSEVRYPFLSEDQKTVTVISKSKTRKSANGLRLLVNNVSASGFSFVLRGSQSEDFSLNDEISVVAIGDQTLANPIPAQVIQKVNFEKKTDFKSEFSLKLGIKLLTPIPDEVFQRFILLEKPREFQNEEFMKDVVFRDQVHTKIKDTMTKLSQKSELRDFMKLLEVNRKETEYLKNHINLLCEINSFIGKKIGWVSPNSLEKLIYVSYLHDIKFVNKPHLARIPTKRGLDFTSEKITPEDRKTYMEAPSYAAELAKTDDHCSPDTHKILIQHKERPDGNGHPFGIKSNQFAPLSCLFMICHEFVDYILEEPEWTYQDFTSQFRKMYRGPYFHKVFQTFDELAENR